MSHACAPGQSLWHTLLSSKVGLIFVVIFFCASLSHSFAQSQDTTPPTLTAFSFTPTTINTAADQAVVIASFSVTDDLSGVRNAIVNMVSPSGAHTYGGSLTFSPPVISGSGIASVTFPQFSEVGIWTVREVIVGDAVGNARVYQTTELSQLGFPTALMVMGQEDVTPPFITVSATPTALWPPNGRMVPVTISGTIKDTKSGVNASTATYAVFDEYGLIQPSGRITTLDMNGNYAFTIRLQASRNGNDQDGRHYTIIVSAQDNEGNQGSNSTVVTVPHDQR
jgi:hypothetical protein